MIYNLSHIQEALGDSFSSDFDYSLAREADIPNKRREGWKVLGTLPDFTTDEAGTMKILGRPRKVE